VTALSTLQTRLLTLDEATAEFPDFFEFEDGEAFDCQRFPLSGNADWVDDAPGDFFLVIESVSPTGDAVLVFFDALSSHQAVRWGVIPAPDA
jgi:hypothetical protein